MGLRNRQSANESYCGRLEEDSGCGVDGMYEKVESLRNKIVRSIRKEMSMLVCAMVSK